MAGAVEALTAATGQTQQKRAAIGQRAEEVARERFSVEQLVNQFLETVLNAEDD